MSKQAKKAKFRVGQRVMRLANGFDFGEAKIIKKWIGQSGDLVYQTNLGGAYFENELRPLTRRERG